MPEYHIQVPNLLIISATRASRPRHQMRSAAAQCKDCTNPYHSVAYHDSTSYSLPQKPIAQMRPLPFGWSLH